VTQAVAPSRAGIRCRRLAGPRRVACDLAARGVTWVVVEEVRSGDWGIGGKPLHTEDVKALAAGTPA